MRVDAMPKTTPFPPAVWRTGCLVYRSHLLTCCKNAIKKHLHSPGLLRVLAFFSSDLLPVHSMVYKTIIPIPEMAARVAMNATGRRPDSTPGTTFMLPAPFELDADEAALPLLPPLDPELEPEPVPVG